MNLFLGISKNSLSRNMTLSFVMFVMFAMAFLLLYYKNFAR